MKQLLLFLGMIVAGVFGYVAEPNLRSRLTVVQASETISETVQVEVPAPGPAIPAAPAIDPASLAPSQLPEKVLINTEVKVADTASGIVMSIPAGNRVKLVKIQGTDAFVGPPGEGPFIGKIAISDTDLAQQLAANPPAPVAPTPEPAAEMVPEAAPAPQGESAEPAEKPEPMVEKPADPAPEAAPETAPAAGGTGDVVKTMQDSVRAGAVKEFTFEQVLDWKAEADEVVDGETYQIGIASYKAETIFGVKTIQAKALLKDGKVQRWVWLKSGMEIK